MSYRVTVQVDVEEWNPSVACEVVLDVLSSDIRIATPVLVGVEENDPTPYCSKCGAKVARQCECGPILAID